MKKLLYPAKQARAAIGCGSGTFYKLINNGTLDARRFGKRTYITAASLEAFVASLPPLVTPTMAKAEHDRWSGRNRPNISAESVAPRGRPTSSSWRGATARRVGGAEYEGPFWWVQGGYRFP